jgi:hypothetical protein
MALCATGAMSLGGTTAGRSVNLELDRAATASINMNEADVRDLADRPTASSAICMADFYGKSSFPTPTTLGTFDDAWGGYYTGVFGNYFLFLAPNATGCTCLRWKTTRTSTAGTGSAVNGFANTYPALNNTTHPAGNFTATRTINGFSDWFLPARDQLNMIYTNNGGSQNLANFPTGEGMSGNLYWSSTQFSITNAVYRHFNFGSSAGNDYKNYSRSVRATRRIPI